MAASAAGRIRKRPIPRPFLKWAGGKTQLADALIDHLPPAFGAYHEPFVGSGALFFRLYRERRLRRAVLSDLNAELVDTYLAIRDHVSEVIGLLAEFPYAKEFYYSMREKDPSRLSLPERAARMIYLNKTGYNGLYRVNRHGKFNVPFGRHESPQYLDPENLIAVSEALKGVDLRCEPFETVLQRAAAGDLVYFDPPYVPLSQTAHFTSYYADGFDRSDQERLRDVCVALSEKSVQVMLSNSETEFIENLYSSKHFEVHRVRASRAINCNASRRGHITELLITNYPVARTGFLFGQ